MKKHLEEALRRFEEDWKPLTERVLDKVLPLPGPKELGRSEYNALPMEDFLDEMEGEVYTWEAWGAEMRRDYPVAWFFRKEVPKPFRRAWRRVDDTIYWLKCHTLPSYRFHILDLRNPGGGDEWEYGWRDRSAVMLWACFKILVEFVEKEEPSDLESYCAGKTEEQIREEVGSQLDTHREMMSLYRWWKTEREAEAKQVDEMFERSKAAPDKKTSRALRDAWFEADQARDRKDQVQLQRLVAIRGYLWT
jgi:hypothetical protein